MDPLATLWAHLNPRVILETQDLTYDAGSFIRDTFFSDRQNIESDQIAIDIKRGQRRLAPFIVPYSEFGVIEQRPGYRTEVINAPWIAPARTVTIPDLNQRAFGERPFGIASPQEKLKQYITTDTNEMRAEIDITEEKMCADLLFTGKVPINFWNPAIEPFSIDYGFTNNVVYSPGNYWTAGGDPIPALVALSALIGQQSNLVPDIMVCAPNVLMAFLGNPIVRDYLKAVGSVILQFDPEKIKPAGATYVGYLPLPGVEMWTYTAGYQATNGSWQPFIPADTVVLGNKAQAKNKIRYAWVQQWEEDPTSGRKSFEVYALPRVPKTLVNVRANIVEYALNARPVPIPFDSLTWKILRVMNSTGATLTATAGY